MQDPTDCHQYYYCIDATTPSDTPLSCPDDEIFNPSNTGPADVCMADDGTCVLTCVPDCTVFCVAPHNFVGDSEDCSVYYSCSIPDWQNHPFRCSGQTPFFDGGSETCVSVDNVCCGECYPYCFTAPSQIPDPTDCTRFYLCVTVGTIDSGGNSLLHCPDGEHFDNVAAVCSPTAPCYQPCTGGSSITQCPDCQDCLEYMTCTKQGYFPTCTTCQSDFFHCSYVGQVAYPEKCLFGRVFDTNPDHPYCVDLSSCPSG